MNPQPAAPTRTPPATPSRPIGRRTQPSPRSHPPRTALLLASLLTTLLALLLPQAAAAQWLRAESANFRVLAKASESRVRQKVQDLERLRQAMLLSFGIDPARAPVLPPFAMALSTDEDLPVRVAPHLRGRDAAGLFSRGIDGVYGFAVVYPAGRRHDFTDVVLFHEYAHRVMSQHARQTYPVWYVEGFAEYFGATVIDADGLAIGAAHPRLRGLQTQPWIKAEDLLKPKFHSSGQAGMADTNLPWFYAQAWLLTHYMLSDSERTRRFNDYFRRLAAGEDALAAFEPATGIAVDGLNAVLNRYMRALFEARLPLSAFAVAEVRITRLPAEEAEAELDGMIIASGPPPEHGRAVLQRLRERVKAAGGEKAPDPMRWALAHGELRYGDPVQALEILSPWAPQDSPPFEASKLLGLAWLAHADNETGAERERALDQARAFLMQAFRQRRNDAPTLYHLARALYPRGPSISLSNAADGASTLEADNGSYTMLAATVHLQAGALDKAGRGLRQLAANPHGGEQVERARAAVRSLEAGRPASEVLAQLRGARPAGP